MAVKFSQFSDAFPTGSTYLVGFDGTTNVRILYSSLLSGTTNYVSKWTSSSALGNSQIFDNGTSVGIGTTLPTFTLQVNGNFSTSQDSVINGVTFGKGGGSLSNNVAAGQTALSSNTTGNLNVAIGNNAMTLSTGANANVAIGNNALQSMTGIDANSNIVAIGHNAMNTKTGLIDSNNVVIGSNAMASGGGTGGQNNVAVGTQAMNSLQTGTRNIAIGFQSMRYNLIGGNNVALGFQSLYNTTGTQNIGLGYTAGLSITTGSNNVVIGGNNGSSIATLSNFMLFADGAGNERFRIPSTGNLLIGTTTDGGYKLDVSGTTRISGTELRLDNGTTGVINLYSTTPEIRFFSGDPTGYRLYRSGTNMILNSGSTITIQIGGNDAYSLTSANGHIWRTANSGGAALARLDIGGSLSIGNGSTAANASSILDLTSTTKGFLPPRMTNAQITAIASPAAGLVVYSTTALTLAFYNGTAWRKVTDTAL